MPRSQVLGFCLTLCLLPAASVLAAPMEPADLTVESAPQKQIGELSWHTDYEAAYREARQDSKQLFIFFRDNAKPFIADRYESDILAKAEMQDRLSKVVRAVLPVDAPLPASLVEGDPAKQPAQPQRLLGHRAFKYLQQRQGLIVIDLTNAKSPLYGKVVSAHPFSHGQYYTQTSTKIILDLPPGSVTQRALIYALKIHPEAPNSVRGTASPYLNDQAGSHSRTMAQLGQVGHHNWGYRFQNIMSNIGGLPVNEVAAMGYGPTLIDAAKSCVSTWRSSPGHWGMISSMSRLYGYDLVEAPGGAWYATGIMAR